MTPETRSTTLRKQSTTRKPLLKTLPTKSKKPLKNDEKRDASVQPFNLAKDPGETKNVAGEHPEKVKDLAAQLAEIRKQGRSRP